MKRIKRPVLTAPALDVGPIEAVALNGDDVAGIDDVLDASLSALSRPSQFCDDGVFRRGDVRRSIEDPHLQSPFESRQVVRIVGQFEEFHRECRAGSLDEVARRAGDAFEPRLWVEAQRRAEL